MLTKITLDGNDISSFVEDYNVDNRNHNQKNDKATITISLDIRGTYNVNLGQTIIVTRGFTTSTDYTVFKGKIVAIDDGEDGISMQIVVRNALWELKDKLITISYDYNTDPSAGKLSAIIEDLFSRAGVDVLVTDSGTVDIMEKFISNNDDYLSRIQTLVNTLRWQMWYDYDNDRAVVEPKGTNSFTTPLVVGGNITNIPVWKENLFQMWNNVTVEGANVLDTQTQSFDGDDSTTSFDLNDEPESVLVMIGGVEQKRGNDDSTDDFDYKIDKDQKKLIFEVAPTTGTGNVVIEYDYKLPLPVQAKDNDSISLYNMERETVFSFDDVRTTNDAQLRAEKILSELKDAPVFTTIKVTDILGYKVGDEITVIDSISGKNETLIINRVNINYPDSFDTLDVGSEDFNVEEYFNDISRAIKELQKKDRVNSTKLTQILSNENIVEVTHYFELWKASIEDGVLYWDSDIQGDWDDFNWGDGTTETQTLSQRIWNANTAIEDFTDNTFIDAASTATIAYGVDGSQGASFTAGQTLISDNLQKGKVALVTATPKITGTGSYLIELSNDDGGTYTSTTNNVELTFPSVDFSGGGLLLESGDSLLLESGDSLLLDGFDRDKILKYRITENGGSTGSITEVQIKHT